jgi:hypothetical protein
MKTKLLIALASVLALPATAQTIVFDFDNAPPYTPLPLDVTAGGVTAHLSATGQGYSIQSVSSAPVVPSGFTGRFIYPSSIYASDLLVSFSTTLNGFSIQYAPQELACDSSATMRVTAYFNGAWVGTATTNATPGTWPVETLAFTSSQPFNSVVVHYDKAPVTGGDYGTIFIADNMILTPTPPPLLLGTPARLANGGLHLSFTNTPATSFTIVACANPTLPPTAWSVLGPATESASGQYEFADTTATNSSVRFYRIRSP